MVQTDISQLNAETADWRQILRNYRDEFAECKRLLLENCKQPLNKDQLKEVEHYQNQFHIQLINIHDLKQDIKNHERIIQNDLSKGDSISDQIFQEHERLLSEFLSLEGTLQELRLSFNNFINATNC
jgi:predicted oxidoreductase